MFLLQLLSSSLHCICCSVLCSFLYVILVLVLVVVVALADVVAVFSDFIKQLWCYLRFVARAAAAVVVVVVVALTDIVAVSSDFIKQLWCYLRFFCTCFCCYYDFSNIFHLLFLLLLALMLLIISLLYNYKMLSLISLDCKTVPIFSRNQPTARGRRLV